MYFIGVLGDYVNREGLINGLWNNILWRQGSFPVVALTKSLFWPVRLFGDNSTENVISLTDATSLPGATNQITDIDGYYKYIEDQGLALGQYITMQISSEVKNDHPDYYQMIQEWQYKGTNALEELYRFRSVLIEADTNCYQKFSEFECKKSIKKFTPIAKGYIETSQSLEQELTYIIEFGKSKGLK